MGFSSQNLSGETENLGRQCLPFLELRQALVCNLNLFFGGIFLKNPETENNFVILQLRVLLSEISLSFNNVKLCRFEIGKIILD